MASHLIINADDFGLTPGINRAVVELHRAGALSSATLMATGSAFEDAIACVQTNPALGIGCHIVLVDGTPVSEPRLIPTLLGPDGKTFRTSLIRFLQALLLGKIDPAEVIREATAQVHKVQRAGIHVTHLDTHKHTHCLPTIARSLIEVAQRCGIAAMRLPFEPAWSIETSGAPLRRRLQLRAVGRFEAAFREVLVERPSGVFVTHGTLGIAATGTLTAPRLRATLGRLLQHAPAATYELCCHPGYVDTALQAQPTRLLGSREVEHAALLSCIPELLRTPGAPALIHYGNLERALRDNLTVDDESAGNERALERHIDF